MPMGSKGSVYKDCISGDDPERGPLSADQTIEAEVS